MSIMVLALLGAASADNENGRGRHKQIYVVPAPGPVVIDGRFADWDLSGQIEMFVVEQTRGVQNAKFALMYDDQALYVSGDVSDPTPMMNRHDPKVTPERAWDADSCQFRLTIDPAVGYPINESAYEYSGPNAKPDVRDDIVHMLLWHFTDTAEANLQMQIGMGFRPPRPEWGPKGLVPRDRFAGEYLRRADGTGYSFEYRIPWGTLGAKQPLKGGHVVAGTVQFNWSRPDGLKTGGESAWAYDILSRPGFPYQSTACWGKMIFSPTGGIPRELVAAGVPPERPLPLEFTYTLPEDAETTVQLFDPAGKSVRILVPQQARPRGRNVERWDGLDDRGNVLPAGEYVWRGVYSKPITAAYRFSVHNSGTPPYPTDDNKGGWGADHGYPEAVCALEDGMLLSWDQCEYGWGIIRTDLDGKKLWGSKHNATHMACDGTRLYLAGGEGFHKSLDILMLDVKDSRPARFANGVAAVAAPAGGDSTSNAVTGLLYHDGMLYIAYAKRNLVAGFETTNGSLKVQWEVPAPERLAMRPDGRLSVISEGKVVTVVDGKVMPWLTTHLDQPVALAIARDGTAYVANRGALQNISVFRPDGRYLRSLGTRGGRPAKGKYNVHGMYMAGGIALDKRGRLWVAETTDGPKRFSVWDTSTGKNIKEFFGGSGYFAYGCIDPARPREIYAHHVLWEIDWKNYRTRPVTTVWRKSHPDMVPPVGPEAYINAPHLVTASNGRQYMWGDNRRISIMLRRDGDLFKPFAAILRVDLRGGRWSEPTGIDMVDRDEAAYPAGTYLWQDRNNDQIVQGTETERMQSKGLEKCAFIWLDKALNVRLSSGHLLRPQQIAPNGQPRYDFAKAEKTAVGASHAYFLQYEDGGMITFEPGKGPSLVGWAPDGTMGWHYEDLPRWHEALNLPMVKAGRLWGMTGCMGVGGDFFVQQTYFGPNHIFRRDGQYVGMLLRDGRAGGLGPNTGQPEGNGGNFVKLTLDGAERYFVIHGGQDTRVWELLGLETVKDLPGGRYAHTEAMVGEVRKAQAAYAAALEGTRRFVVARGRKALEVAETVGKTLEDRRGFQACMAYDTSNLYVRYDVTAPHELVSSFPDPKLIFKGGNLLDIQLAANAAADPARKTPAPGDVRLLISRREGKPVAILYRPKIQGFTGEPIVLNSPTGKESFDGIEPLGDIQLEYRKTDDGFTATATIPLQRLGLTLAPGQKLKADLGYIFGNAQGMDAAVRAYAYNNSFTANVVDDIPHESRLEPAEWGTATVE